MNLKKTLFLTELYPPLVGGTCTMFASRFGLYAPEKIVILTKAVPHAQDFDKHVNYQITRVPLQWKGPKGFEWLGVVWGLLKTGILLALKQKVEIIQCARPLPEGIAGYVLAKVLFKKLVINFQGEDISVLQNYRVERFLLKTIIRSAHLNLAISTFTENLVKALGGPNVRTGVIPPGFDPTLLKNLEPQKIVQLRQKFGGSPILLTVGRLQRRKGQDHVIRALPKVVEQFPEVKYLIIGSTHGGTTGLQQYLEEIIEETGMGKHVEILGEIGNQELPYYYAACDLFLMPNRFEPGGDVEGFGIVFLEAGFLGKSVIGGNSGGVPDAVQDGKTGLLVDGNSVEEIAQGILKILSDDQFARKLGEQGKNFSLLMTYEKVFAQYQLLMTKLGL
ncbi:glycosyl transferase, group 1 [Candidatus Vecturithrix granuli]|uniref:Glycosyl transferase, group 1 n=1 Tax=Vecturithrix granuli TaxID=1499967 RepID=A0A081C4B0_VECG1|nr:glycosyl transferase, group 1 [Candidatus Vecturithrix granuli]